MEIKIFLPLNAFKYKYYYGYERQNKDSLAEYFIIKCSSEKIRDEKLKLIGDCDLNVNSSHLKFVYENEQLIEVIGKNIQHFNVFHYNPNVFNIFNASDYESVHDNFMLYLANAIHDEQREREQRSLVERLSCFIFNMLIAFSDILSTIFHPIAPIFQKTSIYRHSKLWRSSFNEKRLRNGSIVFDILIGISLCVIMYHIRNPENYFMKITELVLEKLRLLLNELDGSPAGLKLNVQLNKFLHSCFFYHVDLWWNFISIVEPAISYLFVPITMVGFMGFTFQCALLCDTITLITLHAHCFYIYAGNSKNYFNCGKLIIYLFIFSHAL